MVWRLGIVTSRIGAMVLMAVVDDLWAFGYFGSHFVMTTIFAVVLTEHLVQMEVAPNSPFWQKFMHGIAMGAALTFCFFNVADSSSLHWIILMYMYAGMQNAEALVEFSREWIISGKPYHGTIAISIVAGGFITGVIAMVLHKRLFNPVCTVYLFPSRVFQMKRAEPQQVGDLLRSVEIASHTDHSLSERTPLADRSC